MKKPSAAICWNSSCGGCDESIVDLEERLLDVADRLDFVLWPCAMDFKYKDVEALEDGAITVALINGGIQNTDQSHVVKMLRRKSKIVVAFGSCACMGGVPSLANLTNMPAIFNVSYHHSPTVVNPGKVHPEPETIQDGLTLTLPRIYATLYKLDDVIPVDYFLPGCPPTADMIASAIYAVLNDELPERGTILAPDKALCTSCNRNDSKPDKLEIALVKRIHEIEADPELCFLAQNVLCMGPATRDGCDYPCIKGNMPCTGCMGPVSGADQGAKMIGSLGAILAGENEDEIEALMGGIPDPAGTFYRYSVSASLIGRKRKGDG
ncbi:MAG: oxidoreductase [Spirochaetota bacterium]